MDNLDTNLEVSLDMLIRGFRQLGIKEGASIMVHSSLSSFGRVKEGAAFVIEALMECVGRNGLIMMPTFTYGKGVYDRKTTPSQTGRITEVFRLSKGVFRSPHPTHSVALWGKDSEKIASMHELYFPTGIKSPFYELFRMCGDVMLIGVDHTANSMIHLAQFIAKVPYLERPKRVQRLNEIDETEEVAVCRLGCSLGFNKIGKFLDAECISENFVGNSKIQRINALEVVNKAVRLLEEDPALLLCERQECFSCNEARGMIRRWER